MLSSFRQMLPVLLVAALCSFGSRMAAAEPAEPSKVVVTVDWTRSVGRANRALFSIQGYPQVRELNDPEVEEAYLRLNPRGTQARLEHWIHRMEPENDNDDPDIFNWNAFDTKGMIRFVEDSPAFLNRVAEVGMEPLILLGYTADWLNTKEGGNTVDDPEEWAEFVAAVSETYVGQVVEDGFDRLPVRYLQLWNEPNFHFWESSDENFFELYNVAARRAKRDHPGLLIGGPTLTGATAYHGEDPADYMRSFLEACGSNTDYLIFHHYGPEAEGTRVLFENLDRYLAMFREITGKHDGKLMMTELDAWYSGPEKIRHLMDRQFGFIDRADDLIAIHQFCLMAYNESGNHTFGAIDQVGGVLPSVYWPYWAFRNWIGSLSFVQVQTADGSKSPLRATATHHENEREEHLATLVLYNPSEAPISVEGRLTAPISESDRVLSVERLIPERLRPSVDVVRWAKGSPEFPLETIVLQSGETVSLTLRTSGRRHFPFADVNNQETPWLFLTSKSDGIGFRDEVELRGEILNTVLSPFGGGLSLAGLPEGWTASLEDDTAATIEYLGFSERRHITYRVRADRVVSDPLVGLSLQFDSDHGSAKSLAHSLRFRRALETFPVTEVVHAVRAEQNRVGLQLRNLSGSPVAGTILAKWIDAEGIVPDQGAEIDFELAPHERKRFYHRFEISSAAVPGARFGEFNVRFFGAEIVQPFQIYISKEASLPDSRFAVLDLSPYANYDAVAFSDDRDDVSPSMGMFSFPADYLPSDEIARAYGIPHRIGDLSAGRLASVLPRGQRISVEAGNYDTAYLLGFGHDGKHPADWILHYADGSTEAVESEIPEWCSAPSAGARRAFSAPHRYLPSGISEPPCELWQWPIAIDSAKTLTAIEFPSFDRAAHIFSVTLRRAR